jgi:hypothetical protein
MGDRIAGFVVGLMILAVFGLIALGVYVEITNPCVRYEQQPCTYYIKAGDVWLPMQSTCSVCVEREH